MAPQPVQPDDVSLTVLQIIKSWWSTVVTAVAAFVGLFKFFEIMLTRKIKEVTHIDAIAATLHSMKDTQERLLTNQELMLGEMRDLNGRVEFLHGVWEGRTKPAVAPSVVRQSDPPMIPIK